MRRQLNLLEYALWSLRRRLSRHAVLISIYALVTGFFGSVVFLTAALRQEALAVLEGQPELWVQRLAGGRLVPVEAALADTLASLRGVQQVLPRRWGYLFDGPTGAVFTVIGADSLPADLLGRQGRIYTDSQSVLCGTGMLALRGLQTGDRLTIQDSKGELRSFEIAGAFEGRSDLLTRDLLIFAPQTAADLLGLPPGTHTDLALRIANPEEVDNIGRKIARRDGSLRVVSLRQLRATYEALFGWRGGILAYGSLIALLAFGILAWERAAGLGHDERRELGLLKSLGWNTADVLTMRLWEGGVISISSTLIGLLLAYVHTFVLDAFLIKPFLIGWSVLYPAYQLYPSIGAGDLLVVTALSVIPYLAATLIPAWYGASIDPAEAMQGH